MREKTLKPWHGAAFFLLIMIVFFVVCVPLQSYFGLYGVAATEILLLILALLFAKVMGYSLRSLFPVHSPEEKYVSLQRTASGCDHKQLLYSQL